MLSGGEFACMCSYSQKHPPQKKSEYVRPIKELTIVTAFLDLVSVPWSNTKTRDRQAGRRRLHIEGDASRTGWKEGKEGMMGYGGKTS